MASGLSAAGGSQAPTASVRRTPDANLGAFREEGLFKDAAWQGGRGRKSTGRVLVAAEAVWGPLTARRATSGRPAAGC